jgi:osmotically inducible lipoprotein OsmB
MLRKLVVSAILVTALAACGRDPGTRAATGGLIGAGAGAGIAAIAGGNAGVGALGGAAVGAIGGAATTPGR